MSITVERVDPRRDAPLLHRWVTHPRSRFWAMTDADVEQVAKVYSEIDADPHHEALLGRVDGEPVFLAELYDPAHSELAQHYDVQDGDVGMHVLVAPPTGPRRPGLTRAVMAAVLRRALARPGAERVVVEPDVRNERIATLNAWAGFTVAAEVDLVDKRAALSFCTRDAFAAAMDAVAVEHLSPRWMESAQRRLVAKILGELAHERLVDPRPHGDDFVVEVQAADGRQVVHRFHAHRHELEHWVVAPWSLVREVDGEPAPIDAQATITDLAPSIGLTAALLPTYLEELASTLSALAWKLCHETRSSAELVDADLLTIEAAMTEGHPAFIANSGRIGFSVDDHAAYAPEAGRPFALVWLAARRDLTHLSVVADLDEETLYATRLDADERQAFEARLRGLGLDPSDYRLLPVHPWQWRHKVAVTFAPDLARRDLVLVGRGRPVHRAQQSIRTYLDSGRPERGYTKTALSIQNMGFMRGLSPAYMRDTPAINDWVRDLVRADPELRRLGFDVLREVAAVGYTGDAYHALGDSSPYTKMVAALWRESPTLRLAEGERAATMASLLHRDRDGSSLLAAMVRASGLEPQDWLRHYLDAYLRPVAHCLIAHGLAFMPHGENVVLVIRDHVPVRVLMKDIGEEVAVLDERPLPDAVERSRHPVDGDLAALSVLTDVFDGFLRFVAAIVVEEELLDGETFWSTVAATLQAHRDDHPELAAAAGRIDLFTPAFAHSCLNRLQLRDTRQMVDLSDQATSLLFAGMLVNPVARFARP